MTSSSVASTPDAEALRGLAGRIDGAPSVARRSAGPFGVAAAYLPGERIDGIRLRDGGTVEIHVVMRWESTVDDVERDVLEAVGEVFSAGVVMLFVDDIADPAGSRATAPLGGSLSRPAAP
jgi:hypothetical protein